MKDVLAVAVLLALGAVSANAQSLEDLNIQIHGYATQGFLYTTENNVLDTTSSNGSPAWTEAVVNVASRPSSKLRVGMQTRYSILGSFGNEITIDWALADYKVNNEFGVRFGKVKTPSGLLNEIQDIDPSYPWVLLPQGIYPLTSRTPELAHLGGVLYGTFKLPDGAGKLDYRTWGGEQVIPTNDGDFIDQTAEGLGPQNSLLTPMVGGALHWQTPLRGLMIGASDTSYRHSSVGLADGETESFQPYNIVDYFGQYNHDKLMVAFEWNRQADGTLTGMPGQPADLELADDRVWYGMATYQITSKLTGGTYYMQAFDHQADLGLARYSKDLTVTGRLDFNDFVYAKAEEHFIKGSDLNFFQAQNPNGVTANTYLTALKIGVNF